MRISDNEYFANNMRSSLKYLLVRFGFEAAEKPGSYPKLTCPGSGKVFFHPLHRKWMKSGTAVGTEDEYVLDSLLALAADELNRAEGPERTPLPNVSVEMPQDSWEALKRLRPVNRHDATELHRILQTVQEVSSDGQ